MEMERKTLLWSQKLRCEGFKWIFFRAKLLYKSVSAQRSLRHLCLKAGNFLFIYFFHFFPEMTFLAAHAGGHPSGCPHRAGLVLSKKKEEEKKRRRYFPRYSLRNPRKFENDCLGDFIFFVQISEIQIFKIKIGDFWTRIAKNKQHVENKTAKCENVWRTLAEFLNAERCKSMYIL